MKKYLTVFSLLLFSASLIFLLNTPSESLAANKIIQKAVDGKALYDANCLGCHGTGGKGTASAPAIRKKGLGDFLEAVRKGEEGMPTFPNLTKKNISAIKYYLVHPKQAETTTTTTTTTTTSSSTTTTNTGSSSTTTTTTSGTTTTIASAPTYTNAVKAILDTKCISCHGGAISPNLTTYSGAYAANNLIKLVVDNGSMPTSGPLSAANVATIDAWVAGGALQ